MDVGDLLEDAFGRVQERVRSVVDGLGAEALAWRPDPQANSIAWLVWHLTRIHDDHVADLAGREQVWTADGWVDRFDLPFDAGDTGFGHSPDQVGAVAPDGPDLLIAYHDAVAERTRAHLASLTPDDLDRVVDERWDPPVTAGVRLVSVLNDQMQHVGQVAYVRGLHERASGS